MRTVLKIPGIKPALLKVIRSFAFLSGYHQRINRLEANQNLLIDLIDKDKLIAIKKRIFSDLQVMSVVNNELIRIGSTFDGGYVIVDNLDDIEVVISIGIGNNLDKERYFLSKGLKVYAFDGTVGESVDLEDKNFKFFPINIGSKNDYWTLPFIFNKVIDLKKISKKILLFIDTEGSEYDILCDLDASFLQLVDQIVIEFHNLIGDSQKTQAFSSIKSFLLKNFVVTHLHGNNYGSHLPFVGGEVIPDVVEVSFASRLSYTFESGLNVSPKSIDKPCNPLLPDLDFSWESSN
jgi:hypothetical protein